MYNNIGGKIKVLAKLGFIVEAIILVLAGIGLMVSTEEMLITGLIVMVVGPIISWVSSWLLYGFGELIDKACDIEYNTRNGGRNSDAQSEVEKLRSQGYFVGEE